MTIRRTLSHGCSGALLLMFFALTVSDTRAGGFQIRSHSAKGFGLSLAGVAAGGQLSYSYWNPATLSDIDRWQVEGVASGIFPSISITPSAATNALVGMLGGVPSGKTEIGRTALVPASYMALPVGDRTTIGVSMTSPFGLSTRAPWSWAGQIYSRESEILSINVNPMISYRINDLLSVGGGLQLQYFRSYLTQAEGLAFNASSAAIRANDIGVGFNLGVQLRPWSGGTVGIGYRSSITHDLDGYLLTQGLNIPAEAKLATPDIVSFGVRQDLSSRTRLMGTVEWSNWSRLGTIPVYASSNGAVLTTLPLRYRDGWLFAVGGEYDAGESLTLRGGLGYEISPLNDVNRDTRFPETNQFIISAGLSYKYSSRLSFDLGYTHAFGLGDGPVNIGPGDPRFLGLPFQASSSLGVGILSIAATYGFEAPRDRARP